MGEMKNEGENKKKGDDGAKKKNNNNDGDKTTSVTVVLKVKMDCECEGCAAKIVKSVRGLEGVETVKSEMAASKLTVTGAVDPAKLREKLEEKLKKKVELISPQPTKKDKENAKTNNNNNNNNDNDNNDKNKPKNSDEKKSGNEKKPKEPPVTTAVLKLKFHCQGCIDKIRKTVAKTKGVQDIKADKQNDVVVVTVKGTMDVKKLTAKLTEKFKRPVEIVPPAKKETKEKDSNGKENNDNGGGGGGGKKKKGGDGQESAGGGGGEGNKADGVANKMEYVPGQPGYGYGYVYQYQYPYGPYGYPVQVHAPQIFSDENPNACAVM